MLVYSMNVKFPCHRDKLSYLFFFFFSLSLSANVFLLQAKSNMSGFVAKSNRLKKES